MLQNPTNSFNEALQNFPVGTVRTMYVHCTYSWYNVRTMYVHCTYSARWVVAHIYFLSRTIKAPSTILYFPVN